MKKIFTILCALALMSVAAYSQQKGKMEEIELNNGIVLQGYVDTQKDGEYKITLENGVTFYYNRSEIKRIGPSFVKETSTMPRGNSKAKYREYKNLYNAGDYVAQPGDKYKVGGIGVASFLIPGFGLYRTGCQVGIGVAQTALWASGVVLIGIGADDLYFFKHWDPLSFVYDRGMCRLIPGIFAVIGSSLWSCISATKAAKIKNMYLRDNGRLGSVSLKLEPYFSFVPAGSNLTPAAGLSLKFNLN